jgi:3-hydroxyisobutyrate dehydrogenase-like beta-hydroxyacid dehydrogenase
MPRRTHRNVGIIGLGIIGSRVREVLRRKDFHVFVWNRTPLPVPNFVGAPAELAEMCDYIQLFVSDDEALLEVAKQLSPGLAARHVVLAHSTVAPHTIHAAAEIVEHRGARFLEAPFTGSKEAAEKGQLVYYIGGDEAALEEVRPILEASARELVMIGGIGQATAIKVTTNMITAACVQAAAEALALVQTAGIPLEKFIDAMEGNASNSKTLALKLVKMIQGDFEPHFSVKHMLKDMQIANRMGLSQHLELSVTSAARDRLLEQMQRGFGDEDYAALIRKYFSGLPTEGDKEGDMDLFESRPVALAPVGDVDLTAGGEVPLPPPAPAAAPALTSDQFDLTHLVPPVAGEPAQPAGEPIAETPAEDETEQIILEESPPSPEMPPGPLEDETQGRHGFLGRLLRRGTND